MTKPLASGDDKVHAVLMTTFTEGTHKKAADK